MKYAIQKNRRLEKLHEARERYTKEDLNRYSWIQFGLIGKYRIYGERYDTKRFRAEVK